MVGYWLALSMALWLAVGIYLLISGQAVEQTLPLMLLAVLCFVFGVFSAFSTRTRS